MFSSTTLFPHLRDPNPQLGKALATKLLSQLAKENLHEVDIGVEAKYAKVRIEESQVPYTVYGYRMACKAIDIPVRDDK